MDSALQNGFRFSLALKDLEQHQKDAAKDNFSSLNRINPIQANEQKDLDPVSRQTYSLDSSDTIPENQDSPLRVASYYFTHELFTQEPDLFVDNAKDRIDYLERKPVTYHPRIAKPQGAAIEPVSRSFKSRPNSFQRAENSADLEDNFSAASEEEEQGLGVKLGHGYNDRTSVTVSEAHIAFKEYTQSPVMTVAKPRGAKKDANLDFSVSHKETYCCGMFKNRRVFIICSVIFYLFLLIIGLVIFWIFPRTPIFTLGTPKDYRPTQYSGDFERGDFVATITLVSNLIIRSDNFIEWRINAFDIKGSLMNTSSSEIVAATNVLKGKITTGTIKPRQESQQGIVLELKLKSAGPITTEASLLANSPGLYWLTKTCDNTNLGTGLDGSPKTLLKFRIDAEVTADPFSTIPLAPASISAQYPCTANQIQVAKYISTLLTNNLDAKTELLR